MSAAKFKSGARPRPKAAADLVEEALTAKDLVRLLTSSDKSTLKELKMTLAERRSALEAEEASLTLAIERLSLKEAFPRRVLPTRGKKGGGSSEGEKRKTKTTAESTTTTTTANNIGGGRTDDAGPPRAATSVATNDAPGELATAAAAHHRRRGSMGKGEDDDAATRANMGWSPSSRADSSSAVGGPAQGSVWSARVSGVADNVDEEERQPPKPDVSGPSTRGAADVEDGHRATAKKSDRPSELNGVDRRARLAEWRELAAMKADLKRTSTILEDVKSKTAARLHSATHRKQTIARERASKSPRSIEAINAAREKAEEEEETLRREKKAWRLEGMRRTVGRALSTARERRRRALPNETDLELISPSSDAPADPARLACPTQCWL